MMTATTRKDAAHRSRTPVALYSLDDVKGALGLAAPTVSGFRHEDEWGDAAEEPAETARLPDATEHQARLSRIVADGAAGCWRDAVGPSLSAVAGLDDLAARAPHLDAFTAFVRRHLLASLAIRLPTSLPPVLLLGAPGTGKTWYLSRLGELLRLPFRTYAMSMSTLGEGIQGAHPSWRNAQPGLVARTLLREREANPLIFVDEFDKPTFSSLNGDPWRPFYVLLDRSGSRRFTDEYLGFEMDASHVIWVMAANDVGGLPAPILDRLTVIEVPAMTRQQCAAVAASIYGEANAARRGFFDGRLSPSVVELLCDMNPRSIRIAVEDAMTRAAAAGRRKVRVGDVVGRPGQSKVRIGFR